jgi:hypothetical protein
MMKKSILWMMAAILTCGLMMTACSDSADNPTVPSYLNIDAEYDVHLSDMPDGTLLTIEGGYNPELTSVTSNASWLQVENAGPTTLAGYTDPTTGFEWLSGGTYPVIRLKGDAASDLKERKAQVTIVTKTGNTIRLNIDFEDQEPHFITLPLAIGNLIVVNGGGGWGSDGDEADYTVMLYTVGGGNLDNQIETDIKNAAGAIKADNKKVRYLIQYKYSSQASINGISGFLPSGKPGHVYRYEASPNIVNTEKSPMLLLKDDYIYGTQNEKAEFFQPDSIVNFMKYCQKVAPAKNYILVLSDHGGGYAVNDDYDKSLEKMGTRATCFDDNLAGRGITCKEIRTALEKSGMHLTMLYFDCCLMNNMETLSEVINLTDYVLASGHTNGGGNHQAFVEELYNASAGDAFTDAMSRYAKTCAQRNNMIWMLHGATWARNVDFVLTDMKKFPAILTALRDYVDFAIKNMGGALAEDFQYAASDCYQYSPGFPLYDLRDYCEKLQANAFGHLPNEWHYYDNLENALQAAQVCHYYSIQSEGYKEITPHWLSYNVSLGAKGFIGSTILKKEPTKIYGYNKDGNLATVDISNLNLTVLGKNTPWFAWSQTYHQLEFDKQTGWSRWLEANTGFPINNPPYDNQDDQQPGANVVPGQDGWEIIVNVYYDTDRPTFNKFKTMNTYHWQGFAYTQGMLMTATYRQNRKSITLPATIQLLTEVEPRAGKTGNWTFVRKDFGIKVLRKYKGESMPDVYYKVDDDLNLSGTDIETEGADVAERAYSNIIVNIDENGKVTFEKHEKSENYILENKSR